MAESPLHTDRAAVLVMMDQADALWGIHGLLMDLEAAVRRIHQ